MYSVCLERLATSLLGRCGIFLWWTCTKLFVASQKTCTIFGNAVDGYSTKLGPWEDRKMEFEIGIGWIGLK